ncbi:sulfoxide reductase heme-binding subunit YedZ [Methylomonas sp. SURF-1]|uniref:Protein-methionine-sulfoxide reductase heme-binding subunit MsrQ n=1 Tax=Methylomonas aurea TaxID=2952224 RepID=A0ABT1UJ32_9GAMM|nr:protein-methionine-sulfoxide reductase heme-binding subunit MsrQ [Methylomonas sp. SURF-1]MCQ8182251.1 sulfoxide reductase heme-binding subunit YedZ [Methylomonas sp. SURF-1]
MDALISRLWPITIAFCTAPLLWLLVAIGLNHLGSNPIQAMHIFLGDWALRFLCITLAITPVQTMTQWRGMTDYRQLFGLTAFFYATLHLLGYLSADHAWAWPMIALDILQSSYLWFGLVAYLILLLLAVTSPKAAKKRLGKSWKKLHRYIYLAAGAAILHYFWQLKGNLAEPLFYLLVLGMLMGFRGLVWLKNRRYGPAVTAKPRAASPDRAE